MTTQTQKNTVNIFYNKVVNKKPTRTCTSLSKQVFDIYAIHVGSEAQARKELATYLEITPKVSGTASNSLLEYVLTEIVKPALLKRYYTAYKQSGLDLEGDSHLQQDLLN